MSETAKHSKVVFQKNDIKKKLSSGIPENKMSREVDWHFDHPSIHPWFIYLKSNKLFTKCLLCATVLYINVKIHEPQFSQL